MKGETHQCGLMLGGNMAQTLPAFENARQSISVQCGKIISHSAIYKSDPWGLADQADYYNQALIIETRLSPFELLDELQETEGRLGRTRSIPNSPRIIDIDILYYDDLIVKTTNLTLPHPRMHQRNFNLIPLAEIYPGWHHPLLNQTLEELIQNSPDPLKVFVHE